MTRRRGPGGSGSADPPGRPARSTASLVAASPLQAQAFP